MSWAPATMPTQLLRWSCVWFSQKPTLGASLAPPPTPLVLGLSPQPHRALPARAPFPPNSWQEALVGSPSWVKVALHMGTQSHLEATWDVHSSPQGIWGRWLVPSVDRGFSCVFAFSLRSLWEVTALRPADTVGDEARSGLVSTGVVAVGPESQDLSSSATEQAGGSLGAWGRGRGCGLQAAHVSEM